jgi:hypothetical protein
VVQEAQDTFAGALATKGDILRLETLIRESSQSSKIDLGETKYDILRWAFGALVAQTAILSLIKFFGH